MDVFPPHNELNHQFADSELLPTPCTKGRMSLGTSSCSWPAALENWNKKSSLLSLG